MRKLYLLKLKKALSKKIKKKRDKLLLQLKHI
jgi:hypothetical protein